MDISNDENQNKPNNNHLNLLYDIEDDEIFLYRKKYYEQIQNDYFKNITPANDNILKNNRGDNV